MEVKLTHKGWFWFCPIYLSVDGDSAAVEARREWLEPLFSICEVLEYGRIWLSTAIWPDCEPSFMFRVTGERDDAG